MIRTGAMGVERKGSLLRMLLKRMKQQDLKKKKSAKRNRNFLEQLVSLWLLNCLWRAWFRSLSHESGWIEEAEGWASRWSSEFSQQEVGPLNVLRYSYLFSHLPYPWVMGILPQYPGLCKRELCFSSSMAHSWGSWAPPPDLTAASSTTLCHLGGG